jgi:hypothetical protein
LLSRYQPDAQARIIYQATPISFVHHRLEAGFQTLAAHRDDDISESLQTLAAASG